KINDPAVHPAAKQSQTVLHGLNKPIVEVVDVQPVGKERNEDRILRGIAVKEQRQAGSNEKHCQKNIMQDFGNVLGLFDVEEELFDRPIAGTPGGYCEKYQRDDHDRGRFAGVLSMIAPRGS